jgi:hypothetical protein
LCTREREPAGDAGNVLVNVPPSMLLRNASITVTQAGLHPDSACCTPPTIAATPPL